MYMKNNKNYHKKLVKKLVHLVELQTKLILQKKIYNGVKKEI